MGMQWYPKYPGDYARDTAHLTMLEHGAYNLLMDYYYSSGEPLPANADANAPTLALAKNPRLYRICRAVTPDEQSAVDSVINDFFDLKDGKYHLKKADEIIARSAEISEKRREAQAERERKRLAAKAANDGASARSDAHTTRTTTTTTIDSKESPPDNASTLPMVQVDMWFQTFWNLYPGRGKDGARGNGYKGGKQEALKSFTRIMKQTKDGDHEETIRIINEGCERYAGHLDRSGYPSKHASTWLNQRGWEDDYGSTSGGKSSGSKHERARSVLAGDDPTFLKG